MNDKEQIVTVVTKYIKGGKEVVKYDTTNGKCWIERLIGEDVKIVKEYNIVKSI